MTDTISPLLDRPIIIVGAPRSGTTLLGKLLQVHPTLAYLEEPRLTWRWGNDRRSDRLLPSDARPEVCRKIREVFTGAVRASGRSRLLEKTPSNALRMGFVEQVLPGCLFVHIMRNGVESALSIRRFWQQHAGGVKPRKMAQRLKEIDWRRAPHYAKEMLRRVAPKPLAGLVRRPVWGPRLPGIDGLVADLELLEVCCLQWRACVEAACQYGRRLPADRYFECRLEDMSPELLRSILEFAQLEDAQQVWDAFEQHFDPAATDHRRRDADPAEIETVRQWIEPTMAWLGYP